MTVRSRSALIYSSARTGHFSLASRLIHLYIVLVIAFLVLMVSQSSSFISGRSPWFFKIYFLELQFGIKHFKDTDQMICLLYPLKLARSIPRFVLYISTLVEVGMRRFLAPSCFCLHFTSFLKSASPLTAPSLSYFVPWGWREPRFMAQATT